jgi:hypothetical protein
LSDQRGFSNIGLLLIIIIATVLWARWEWSPVDAEELKTVILLAESTPKTKATLVTFLKNTPNPDRWQLRSLSSEINEELVTQLTRLAIGVDTLSTTTNIDPANAVGK